MRTDKYTPTADDLALLDAGALWLSDGDLRRFHLHIHGADWSARGAGLLDEPFEGAMLLAVMKKLRASGKPCWVGFAGDCQSAQAGSHLRSHPSSPLLALLGAMRKDGILRTEPTIEEVARRAVDRAADGDAVRLAKHVLGEV